MQKLFLTDAGLAKTMVIADTDWVLSVVLHLLQKLRPKLMHGLHIDIVFCVMDDTSCPLSRVQRTLNDAWTIH